MPIGREPGPDWVFEHPVNAWLIRRLLPGSATLQGTVLRTENARCDLATAAVVRVRSAILTRGGSESFTYLEARQDRTQPPVRLLLVAFNWFPVTPEHLRVLAGLTEARPRGVAVYLRAVAARAERRDQPIDWSFRAGPMASRRISPGEYDLG